MIYGYHRSVTSWSFPKFQFFVNRKDRKGRKDTFKTRFAFFASSAVNLKPLPFFENEKRRQHDERETHQVIPSEFFFQIENWKKREDNERDDLLDGFKLGGAELPVPHPVGGDLKNILEKRDTPTGEDHDPEGFILVF